MSPSTALLFAALSALVNVGVNAQSPVWGQCGGNGWTGSTECVSGSVCTKQNDWYSQCIPGPAPTQTSSASAKPTSTTSTTSIKPSSTSLPPPSSTFSTSTTSSTPTAVPGLKYFFTFGDSYTQTGFEISGTKPSPQNPLGNPALPGWTTSGGLHWLGYLISQYNTSTTLSYNFAYGGATTNASIVAPYTPSVLSFIDQVKLFSANLAAKPAYAAWTPGNTLVGVWMGVNDVGNVYWKEDVGTILGTIMDSYFGQLKVLVDAGLRNFVLLSVPPIDKSPLMLSQDASARTLEASVIKQYNSLLASRLALFKSQNPAVATAVVVDTQAPFNKAIANPTAYGAKDAACWNQDGKTCLWFNDYHPGMAIHKLVAEAVVSALKGSWF